MGADLADLATGTGSGPGDGETTGLFVALSGDGWLR
jgi:hypothetical protein